MFEELGIRFAPPDIQPFLEVMLTENIFKNFQYYCLFPLRPWLFLYRFPFRDALACPYKQYEIYIFQSNY